MATIQSASSGSRPCLRVSRAEAAQAIRVQFERGQVICEQSLTSEADFARARSRAARWFADTSATLVRLFDDPSVGYAFSHAFVGASPDSTFCGGAFFDGMARRFVVGVKHRLALLESLRQGLDGYEICAALAAQPA